MARDTSGGQQRKQPRRNEDAETNESAEVSEELKEIGVGSAIALRSCRASGG
jgi:hypothetical protein